jgi:hypothetical protein
VQVATEEISVVYAASSFGAMHVLQDNGPSTFHALFFIFLIIN